MANEAVWKAGREWGQKNPTATVPANAPQDFRNGARAGQGGK